MRPRLAVATLFLVAACGEAAPQTPFTPVPDADQVAVETAVTSTTTTNPLHQIDPTARNPFEPYTHP